MNCIKNNSGYKPSLHKKHVFVKLDDELIKKLDSIPRKTLQFMIAIGPYLGVEKNE